MAGELADKKPFEPPLKGTKEEINSDGSGKSEDNFGKRHTTCGSVYSHRSSSFRAHSPCRYNINTW